MSKSKMIVRTKFIDRACHWTVVICFFWWRCPGFRSSSRRCNG